MVLHQKKMQNQYKNAARIWNLKETEKIIALLSKTDITIRQMGNSVEDNLLELMLYSIIVKKGDDISKMDYERL